MTGLVTCMQAGSMSMWKRIYTKKRNVNESFSFCMDKNPNSVWFGNVSNWNKNASFISLS